MSRIVNEHEDKYIHIPKRKFWWTIFIVVWVGSVFSGWWTVMKYGPDGDGFHWWIPGFAIFLVLGTLAPFLAAALINDLWLD